MGEAPEEQSDRLEASAKRLLLALKAARAGAWEWDIATGRTRWSEGNYLILGLPPGDGNASYDKWFERVHPDDRERATRLVAEAVEVRGDLDFEYRAVWPDGTERWIRDVGKMLLDDQGEPAGMYGIQIDVTEKHELESALRRSQRMKALGLLAGGLAHDFNNLLTVIAGYGDLLQDRLDADSSLQAMVDEILRASDRAAGLTNQLLAIGRRQVLRPEALDLNRAIEEIRELLTTTVGESVDLVVDLQPDLGRVWLDHGQLEQVLINLVVNARDAMPNGGKLVIRTSEPIKRSAPSDSGENAFVSLSVRDTGTGIAPEILEHIFDPFFTTKSDEHGSGLGLASVYGIVQQSGGEIEVDTELGEGTTLTLYLPRHEGTEEVEAAPRQIHVAPGGTGTILLVEDYEPIRHFVERVLSHRGYNVLAASSAEEALEVVAAHDGDIELLLSDIILPKASGPELRNAVREKFPSIAVLYMSGYGHSVTARHGVLAGGSNLLQKPFAVADLENKVHEILRPNPAE